jgi:hypothetical protein
LLNPPTGAGHAAGAVILRVGLTLSSDKLRRSAILQPGTSVSGSNANSIYAPLACAYAAVRFSLERKLRKVMEYRNCSTGGMLCCHPDRASSCIT